MGDLWRGSPGRVGAGPGLLGGSVSTWVRVLGPRIVARMWTLAGAPPEMCSEFPCAMAAVMDVLLTIQGVFGSVV